MTSSLVGSEMCIRDRGIAQEKILEKILGRHLGKIMKLKRALIPKSSLPVSYTHLTLPTICSV
eukprot:1439254-Prorocentrum_lima.AAC.1